jgi:hypothetical protein
MAPYRDQVCRLYLEDRCNLGISCRSPQHAPHLQVHAPIDIATLRELYRTIPGEASDRPICADYARGTCPRRSSCRFSHITVASHPRSTPSRYLISQIEDLRTCILCPSEESKKADCRRDDCPYLHIEQARRFWGKPGRWLQLSLPQVLSPSTC